MEQAGIDKACEILNSFKSFLTSFNIENVSAFTTAALRNAQNSKEAVAEIIARTGIDLHIISGDEEATYDFIAATHELDYHDGFIIDIGGASTELIRFADNKIIQKTSLPIGSLALHTKYATDFLPSEEEIAQMIKEVHAIIDTAPEFKDISHAEICGIGGTCKGARALYNEMYTQDDANETIPADKILLVGAALHQGNSVGNGAGSVGGIAEADLRVVRVLDGGFLNGEADHELAVGHHLVAFS